MTSHLANVDPWLLAHGIIFTLNYAILMPVATFLIILDRERFYQGHNILGVIITVLLVAGWATLSGATAEAADGGGYSPMSDSSVGLSHSVTGIVGRFFAVVVCIVGVILGVVRMPKHIRFAVRWAHGVAGVALSFYGPLVVWNGWVRIQPFIPSIPAFDSTPMVWYTFVILLCLVLGTRTLRNTVILSRDRKLTDEVKDEPDPTIDVEKAVPVLSVPDVVELIKNDKESLFFFFENQVIRIDDVKSFDHPGGVDILSTFNGKDITGIVYGEESFEDQGRQRRVPHSSMAVRRLLDYRVGKIDTTIPTVTDSSTALIDDFPEMFSIDEEGKSVGIISDITTLNNSPDFPVRKFLIKIVDPVMLMRASAGMKIRLSLSLDDETDTVERTYTIVSLEKGVMELIIKMYPEGALTSRLVKMTVNQPLFFSKLASAPQLSMELSFLLFLAGGTGIVPLMYYIESTDARAHVLWSVRKVSDLFHVIVLNEIIDKFDGKLKITIQLTGEAEAPTPESLGFSDLVAILPGRIQESTLSEILVYDINACGAIMSGPPNFIECMHASLTATGLDARKILSLD